MVTDRLTFHESWMALKQCPRHWRSEIHWNSPFHCISNLCSLGTEPQVSWLMRRPSKRLKRGTSLSPHHWPPKQRSSLIGLSSSLVTNRWSFPYKSYFASIDRLDPHDLQVFWLASYTMVRLPKRAPLDAVVYCKPTACNIKARKSHTFPSIKTGFTTQQWFDKDSFRHWSSIASPCYSSVHAEVAANSAPHAKMQPWDELEWIGMATLSRQ